MLSKLILNIETLLTCELNYTDEFHYRKAIYLYVLQVYTKLWWMKAKGEFDKLKTIY